MRTILTLSAALIMLFAIALVMRKSASAIVPGDPLNGRTSKVRSLQVEPERSSNSQAELITKEPSRVIVFEIVDVAGRPVPDAAISLANRSKELARSTAEGIAEVREDLVPYNQFDAAELSVNHLDYSPEFVLIVRGVEKLRIALGKASSLRITVTDSVGSPIRDASISVYRHQTQPVVVATGISDEKGTIDIGGLPGGIVEVVAKADGYSAWSKKIRLLKAQSRQLDIRLAGGREIEVQVVAMVSRLPIPDVLITLAPLADDRNTSRLVTWSARTNTGGLGQFKSIPFAMKYVRISTSHDRYINTSTNVQLNSSPKQIVVIDLHLGAGLKLSIADEVGKLIEGEVIIREAGSPFSSFSRRVSVIAGEAKTVWGIPPHRPLALGVVLGGATTSVIRDIVLTPEELREVKLVVPKSIALKLLVRNEAERPRSGVIVMKSTDGKLALQTEGTGQPSSRPLTYRKQTDASGRVNLNVRPGTYELTFDGHLGDSAQQGLTVSEDDTVIIHTKGGKTFAGKLLDEGNTAIAAMQLVWRDGRGMRRTITGVSGAFEITDVDGSPGKLFALHEYAGGTLLFDGKPPDEARDFTLRRVVIRGHVTNYIPSDDHVDSIVVVRSEGAPHAQLYSSAISTASVDWPHVDEGGNFELRLPPGKWTIRVELGGRRSTPVSIEVGRAMSELSVNVTLE